MMVAFSLVGSSAANVVRAEAAVTPSPLASAANRNGVAPPRIVFLGDSVMDQQGAHAVELLRAAGVAARVEARWGSTLFTPGQYRNGKPVPRRAAGDESIHWLSLGPQLVRRHRATHVIVELDHNYWKPPTDSAGRPITDLDSPPARRMVRAQLSAFVGSLRAEGADVLWVAPTPSETVGRRLWPAMRTRLAELRVPVLDPNESVRRTNGAARAHTRTCTGETADLFLRDRVHLTRLGAGLTGTDLARDLAARLRIRLPDSAAPGQPAVAIVPVDSGYYIVQCDGSVFRFGAAPALRGAHSRIGAGAPVVDASAAPNGGLWLHRADGTTIGLGTTDEPPTPYVARTKSQPLQFDAPTGGFWRVDRQGRITTHDGAIDLGNAVEVLPTDPFARAWAIEHPRPPVVDAAVGENGLYVLTENGEVVALGAARHFGDTADLAIYTD